MTAIASKNATDRFSELIDWTIERVGTRLVVGVPLGLGKPNELVNAFYHRARQDPSLHLNLVTALSLNPPLPGSELERRFLAPFSARHFGADYPRLAYADDQLTGRLPENVIVSEFYFQSGSRLGNEQAQRNYISSNYTHVARDFVDRGANVLLQLVAQGQFAGQDMLSLSCNPDVTIELKQRLRRDVDYPWVMIGQVHPQLPFMHGEALVSPDFFDRVVPHQAEHKLFAVPRGPVPQVDHAIGLHASTLIADNGTLQIGIGSLGDALVNALILRHDNNDEYRKIIDALGCAPSALGDARPFERGLFGASEMFMDGFMHLYRAGILKRQVYEDLTLQMLADHGQLPLAADRDLIEAMWSGGGLPRHLTPRSLRRLQQLGVLAPRVRVDDQDLIIGSGRRIVNDWATPQQRDALAEAALAPALAPGIVLEAAFFLGSAPFYQWLAALDDTQRPQFVMSPVAKINQLYGGREELELRQRRHARFVNTAMMMTLTGAAVSDGLKDYQMVSGVGGQYNFVAMAQAMTDGRSVLMLRSTRQSGGRCESSIVWDYPHITIPRHLRDLVITEYGVADLRGRTDEECIEAMVGIADARFQQSLVASAQAAGKLRAGYRIPDAARENRPESLNDRLAGYAERLPPFPFGHDFDPVEARLVAALGWLKNQRHDKWALAKAALGANPRRWPAELQRMALDAPAGLGQRLLARLVAAGLGQTLGTDPDD